MSNSTAPPTPLPASLPPAEDGNQPFGNPYVESPQGGPQPLTTVMCKIHTLDYNLIKSIRPAQGTNTGVIGTLWKKLVNELSRKDISDFSKVDEFERFIANCHIVSHEDYTMLVNQSEERNRLRGLLNGTISRAVSDTAASDESTGPGEPRAGAEAAKAVGTDVQGGSGVQRRRSSKDKKG
jgi:hypothetical protein